MFLLFNETSTIGVLSGKQLKKFIRESTEKHVKYRRIKKKELLKYREIRYGRDAFFYNSDLIKIAEKLSQRFGNCIGYYIPNRYFPMLIRVFGDEDKYIMISPYRIVRFGIDEMRIKLMEGYNAKRKRGKGKKTDVGRHSGKTRQIRPKR